MGRKRPAGPLPFLAALATWVAAASLAQGLFGLDVGHAGPALEEQLQRKGAPPAPPQPERSHDDQSYEPWELVKV